MTQLEAQLQAQLEARLQAQLEARLGARLEAQLEDEDEQFFDASEVPSSDIDFDGIKCNRKNTLDNRTVTSTLGMIKQVVFFLACSVWADKNKLKTIRLVKDKMASINWSILYEENVCKACTVSGPNAGNRCKFNVKNVNSGLCTRHHNQYMKNYRKIKWFDGKYNKNRNDEHEVWHRNTKERRDKIDVINPFEFNAAATDDRFDLLKTQMEKMAQAVRNHTDDIVRIDRTIKDLRHKGVIPPQFSEKEVADNIKRIEEHLSADPKVEVIVDDGSRENFLKIKRLRKPDGDAHLKDMLEKFPENDIWSGKNERLTKEHNDYSRLSLARNKAVEEEFKNKLPKRTVTIEPEITEEEIKNDIKRPKGFVDPKAFFTISHAEPVGERPDVNFDHIINPEHKAAEETKLHTGQYDMPPSDLHTNQTRELVCSLISPVNDKLQEPFINRKIVAFGVDEEDYTYKQLYMDFKKSIILFRAYTDEGRKSKWLDYYHTMHYKIICFGVLYGKRPTFSAFNNLITDMIELKDMMDAIVTVIKDYDGNDSDSDSDLPSRPTPAR